MIFAVFYTPIFRIFKIGNFRAPNGASVLNHLVLANENRFFLQIFFKAGIWIGTRLRIARNRLKSLSYDVLRPFEPNFAKCHERKFFSLFQYENESHIVMGFTKSKNLKSSFGRYWRRN